VTVIVCGASAAVGELMVTMPVYPVEDAARDAVFRASWTGRQVEEAVVVLHAAAAPTVGTIQETELEAVRVSVPSPAL
jgi:hypothetical protein